MVRRVDGDLIDRLRWLGCSRIKWDHREDAKIFDGEVRQAGESTQPTVKLREVWESNPSNSFHILEWCRVKPSMRNHLLFKILYLYPDFPYHGKFEAEEKENNQPWKPLEHKKPLRVLEDKPSSKLQQPPEIKPSRLNPLGKKMTRDSMIRKSLAAVVRNSTSPLRSSSSNNSPPTSPTPKKKIKLQHPPAPTIAIDKENAQPGEMYESGRGMQVCWPNRTVSHHYYTVLNNTRRWKDNQRRLQSLRKLYAEIVGEYPMMAPVLWTKLREELPNFDIK